MRNNFITATLCCLFILAGCNGDVGINNSSSDTKTAKLTEKSLQEAQRSVGLPKIKNSLMYVTTI